MGTKNSRDLLDWFRLYAQDRFTSLGWTTDASNLNLALNSDTRVQSAIDYLVVREAEIIAAWNPAWDANTAQVAATLWSNLLAAMPANIQLLWADLWADPDPNVRCMLKVLMRVLYLAELQVAGGG